MTNFNLPRVAEEAPAAAPRKRDEDRGLLDTTAFLKHVRKAYRMNEVGLAVQGKRHADSKKAKAKDGRHMVAASRRKDGLTFFLLNSHFKDRRAHIGLGVQQSGSFLIGPALAVQRWKGYSEPVEALAGRFADMAKVIKALRRMKLQDREIIDFARSMAKRGYLTTIESRPAGESLIEGLGSKKALDVGFHVINRMREGDLQVGYRIVDGRVVSTANGRRVKRVRRPDGLFHGGLVAFDLLLSLAHAHRAVASSISFGDLKERLIRP